MSIEDAKKASFDLIGLQGKWLKLIGQACKPTHFFVYGIGGSGKSSFVLLFSQYLASLSYKILYVAGEQFGTPTFTELLKRLNITAGDNFKIVDSLNRNEFVPSFCELEVSCEDTDEADEPETEPVSTTSG